jgi:hypothetical protein
MLPALPRLAEVYELIEGKFYFTLHGPRQSGKTTFLKALTDKINAEGKMYALNCSLMNLRGEADDEKAMTRVVELLNTDIKTSQIEAIKQKAFSYDIFPDMVSPATKVRSILNYLCEDLDKDLVVFFDDVDCLSYAPLSTFLSQIRDAYNVRPKPGNKFPRSMAFVGLKDIRDYLAQERANEMSTGFANPFNIVKESLTLETFTEREIEALYYQHTIATTQVFEPSAIKRAWYWSEGQPWLVNVLADQVIVEALKYDYSVTITGAHIDQAAEALIQRGDTHLVSLLERLKEPRVARVMEAVFSGTKNKVPLGSDDLRYCVDLGLVVQGENKNLRPANQLYGEVMSRYIRE